ncbi:MAG: c-type cytochrome [Planktomarina sp.]|nr:c-type cytochrome [Planktomarina sp.]
MAQAAGAGDPALGAAVYKKCQSCHQVGDQAKSRVGPQLNDIFGRTAGGLEGAKYSKSMMRAGQDGLIWSEETLDKFLETPKSLVAKTQMSFRRKIRHRDSNYRKERWAALRVAQGQAARCVMRLRSAFWDHKMAAQPQWL